ncbi:hypothetical protein BN7_4762 [Wickerhamomyces ciferrii]|uniref:Uncharacterized protein n=1 Tax=Wickerhamomyces ciferrii (strain ATCC 14091 / BCRC 22168 / CBS 111 / JCM 3599 / NBRC 0793 / NRRL Y-1031 F-60-10) TaxID=1206466 RepID=K0KQ58_WICCF|nr:uncharacterized protein BN7_4762 [Wickerhamomyces ciferrii]CCH45181.1 hypothetical protein BN7_4762 [Wickerhamomyces ciferrii]
MIIEKAGYRIEIYPKLYVYKPKHEYSKANNILLAKSPKHFKLDHETFNNFHKDKVNNKLISVYKEVPKPSKELTLNHKSILIKWRKINESTLVPKRMCDVSFYLMPGYDLKDCLVEILFNLIKNFQSDIPDFLYTESFGNGLDMIEENKLLMNIYQPEKYTDLNLPLRIIIESLITFLMSDEYEKRGSFDHIVKAYEFNYQDQLKIMAIWGEEFTLQNYEFILQQLNYMISNDVLSEPHNQGIITLIPGYLNYNINSNNDELPPSYESSVLK